MKCPNCGIDMKAGYLFDDLLRGIRFKPGVAPSSKAEVLYGNGVAAHRCGSCNLALVPDCPLR